MSYFGSVCRTFCCCSCYCLPRTSFLEEKARNSSISVWPRNFPLWIHCNTWSNLTQEIQFLEFMGGSNLTYAHSNYLICMHFIQINTVSSNNSQHSILSCLLSWVMDAKYRVQIYMPQKNNILCAALENDSNSDQKHKTTICCTLVSHPLHVPLLGRYFSGHYHAC